MLRAAGHRDLVLAGAHQPLGMLVDDVLGRLRRGGRLPGVMGVQPCLDLQPGLLSLVDVALERIEIRISDCLGSRLEVRLVVRISPTPDLHHERVEIVLPGELDHALDLLRIGHMRANYPYRPALDLVCHDNSLRENDCQHDCQHAGCEFEQRKHRLPCAPL